MSYGNLLALPSASCSHSTPYFEQRRLENLGRLTPVSYSNYFCSDAKRAVGSVANQCTQYLEHTTYLTASRGGLSNTHGRGSSPARDTYRRRMLKPSRKITNFNVRGAGSGAPKSGTAEEREEVHHLDLPSKLLESWHGRLSVETCRDVSACCTSGIEARLSVGTTERGVGHRISKSQDEVCVGYDV